MSQKTIDDFESSGVECEYCHREFSNQPALNSHVGHSHDVPSKVEVDCEYCGETKETPRYRLEKNNNHFCDDECKGEWQSENIKGEDHPNYNSLKRNCDWCGEQYEYPNYYEGISRFCSQDCQLKNTHENGDYPTGEDHPRWDGSNETRTCEWCGNDFTCRPYHTFRHCSFECAHKTRGENMSGEDHPLWEGGVSLTLTDWLRRYMSDESWHSIRERHADVQECEMCGVEKDEIGQRLSLHHIIPLTSGGTNGDWNLMNLCESCHKKAEIYTKQHVSQHLPTSGSLGGIHTK